MRTYGQTVEFADYREYMLGDDIRRIDWNLYSRFEKFFLKLFTDERQMHTQIFIDCSASMGKDMPEKAGYTIAAAAALGYLSVHNMDKVSFKLIKGDKGDFVSMPSTSWKNKQGDRQYEDVAHPLDADTRAQLYRAVQDAYFDHTNPMAQSSGPGQLPFGW